MAVPRDVFIVCNNTDAMGGLQRWAHHLAGLLASRGAKVTLVGVTHAPERHRHQRGGSYSVVALHDAWHPPALAWRPGSVRQRMNVRARARDLWRTAAMRQGAARLSSLFGAARPGAVVIVAQVWAMEWVRHADTTGLKIVGMSHESYRATRRSTRYARVREHYACADRFLALTAEDADAWARAGMSNADHMPNPLHVLPGPAAPLDAPVVACVGRLAHEKGVDLLLEAWEEVAARHPRWRLRVYGDGPEEAALIDRAEAAGLGGSIEFRGVTGDVGAALGGASVFALPSRDEGFPMSVLESMAQGLPTVAFDCAPGVRELLEDGASGLLVPPGDTVAFAAALDRLIGDAALRRTLGAEARVSVLRYHPDRVLGRWERLFDLLHREPPAGVPEPLPGRAPRRSAGERSGAGRPVVDPAAAFGAETGPA